MQLIDRVSRIEKIRSVDKVKSENEMLDHSSSFQDVYQHEAEKRQQEQHEQNDEDSQVRENAYDQAGIDFYDNHAQTVLFLMGVMSTDLKG